MSVTRTKISVRGAVQGVGFRPFVYRLATELRLAGSVQNSTSGVDIEVQGEASLVHAFMNRLERERPPQARIGDVECAGLPLQEENGFEIKESSLNGARSVAILPDLATCSECVQEIFDPANRRYLYPFTNCTHCGPRFSIIEAVPYDRANTSMKYFAMCAACEAEYRDPCSRRFHAQPNACPICGPALELWSHSGEAIARSGKALSLAADAVRSGLIVALKGIGGFQLLADARNPTAIRALRERKNRPDKPFAVMFPSLAAVQLGCEVNDLEQCLLLSAEAPIVILDRRGAELAQAVAPGNPRLGVMLPYSPLHHLLMQELSFPIVATSGNISDEPICIHEWEALERLEGIADLFLVHNRPVVRHVDDSIVQVVGGREMMIRRARGYAPLPLRVGSNSEPILAVGAHLKNSVALAVGQDVFLSQHIGNLETDTAVAAFHQSVTDLPRLYEAQPSVIVHDLHPDYASTQYAEGSRVQTFAVQHHYAHVLACMAENRLQPPVLGVAWDGTGLGTDGSVWGGEFLLVTNKGFERVAHLRQFRLPGGDLCMKETGRCALGMLYEMFGSEILHSPNKAAQNGRLAAPADPLQRFLGSIPGSEMRLISHMLERNICAPITSSAGRLFDAVAALVGLRVRSSFEGQAAMELEFSIDSEVKEAYRFPLRVDRTLIVNWERATRAILEDIANRVSIGTIAAKFHNGLAEAIVQVAQSIGERKLTLTGGCFQNKYLLEASVRRLIERGFQCYWHREIPANDGGIAFGQIIAAARALIIANSQSPALVQTTKTDAAAVETCA